MSPAWRRTLHSCWRRGWARQGGRSRAAAATRCPRAADCAPAGTPPAAETLDQSEVSIESRVTATGQSQLTWVLEQEVVAEALVPQAVEVLLVQRLDLDQSQMRIVVTWPLSTNHSSPGARRRAPAPCRTPCWPQWQRHHGSLISGSRYYGASGINDWIQIKVPYCWFKMVRGHEKVSLVTSWFKTEYSFHDIC